MRSLAAWCVRHRLAVVAGWLVALIGTFLLASVAGGNAYSDGFDLPDTESSHARALLEAASPKLAGDTEQVVIATRGAARVADPAVRTSVTAALTRVAALPHVSRIQSPYDVGPEAARRTSPDGTVAFASVTFDQQESDVDQAAARRFVAAAQSGSTDQVGISISGHIAQRTEKPQLGGTGIGVALAGVVLLLVFGSVAAMLLPLVSALISLGTAFSVISLVSHVVAIPQFAPQLTALVGLGVGVDYALFIVTRHRQGLIAGRPVAQSVAMAINTSGRAVLFAGIIVCIALLGMFALGVSLLHGLALSASIGVLLTMFAALTLTPALLSFIGLRALSGKQRKALAESGPRIVGNVGFWPRWADRVQRRPVIAMTAGLVVVVTLALPFLSLRLGISDQGNDPKGSTTRTAYDDLARGFGPGFNGPLVIVGRISSPADRAALAPVVEAVRADRAVRDVGAAEVIPAADGSGSVALITAYPAGSPQDASTADLITRLRDTALPAALAGSDLHLFIGGSTATISDLSHVLASKLPLFVGVVVLLSFLLLAVVFRSIWVPAAAAVMNLLSAAAAYGVVVALIQYGWLAPLIGVDRRGPVDAFVPVLLFAILFGLSMDYEVFLVARIHEEWVHTGDNAKAVRNGLATTGKTITAAALIMILVFASFIFGGQPVIKEFGLGLAAGVFLDAFVIRSVIIPSVMQLVGKANWWFPPALDRVLPRLHVEADETPVEAAAEPVGVSL